MRGTAHPAIRGGDSSPFCIDLGITVTFEVLFFMFGKRHLNDGDGGVCSERVASSRSSESVDISVGPNSSLNASPANAFAI
jgi:hypothetical protein